MERTYVQIVLEDYPLTLPYHHEGQEFGVLGHVAIRSIFRGCRFYGLLPAASCAAMEFQLIGYNPSISYAVRAIATSVKK